MACGRPVITTPVGGMLDVVKDGENGISIPVNDADPLAKAIDEVLNKGEIRYRLAKAARQIIIDCSPFQKELDANLDEYRRLGLNP